MVQKEVKGQKAEEKRKADEDLDEGKERGSKLSKKEDSKFWTWAIVDKDGNRVD